MTRKVAIVGMGQTKHGKRQDVSMNDLIHEAVTKALDDAHLSIKDVDAIVSGSMPAPMEGYNGVQLSAADALGAYLKPLIRVATCGTTGMSIAHSNYYHVASGLFDTSIVVGFEKMYECDNPQNVMTTIWDYRYQWHFLAGAPGMFALQCNEYAARYGISEEDMREAAAEIAVRNHNDALDNPYAHIQKKVTVDDILKSRIVSYPIRLFDVCPISDGACAIVMTSEEKARKITDNPVWVKGVGYIGDEGLAVDKDLVEWAPAIEAARRAYKMAGIENPLKQIDVAEIYNPFSYLEIMFYENFGFCEKGKALQLVKDRVVFREGDLPCDPSGGVLCTNPIGATALIRVAEAALQIRGEAGARQVPGVETALSHGMGGAMSLNGIMILGKEP